jgi:putative alpha-1,2-mannosidase
MYQGATQSQANAGRSDIEDWINIGYVAYDVDQHGCSETLEYALDDWAISGVATALGKSSDAAMFFNRSKNYENMWNHREKYMCPKTKAGAWECPIIKTNFWDKRYVEGDAEHWRFFVPHDPSGLIQVMSMARNRISELSKTLTRTVTCGA